MLNADAAMKFEDAMKVNDSKPMAVFIYSDWAQDKDDALTGFRNLSKTMGNGYNYVEINISAEDAEAYCETYPIYPKLPYIVLYRGRGKFIRIIDREYIKDNSYVTSRMKQFVR